MARAGRPSSWDVSRAQMSEQFRRYGNTGAITQEGYDARQNIRARLGKGTGGEDMSRQDYINGYMAGKNGQPPVYGNQPINLEGQGGNQSIGTNSGGGVSGGGQPSANPNPQGGGQPTTGGGQLSAQQMAAKNLHEFYGGKLPSVQERAPLAARAGIQNYTGTEEQNVQLLAWLKANNGGQPPAATGGDQPPPAEEERQRYGRQPGESPDQFQPQSERTTRGTRRQMRRDRRDLKKEEREAQQRAYMDMINQHNANLAPGERPIRPGLFTQNNMSVTNRTGSDMFYNPATRQYEAVGDMQRRPSRQSDADGRVTNQADIDAYNARGVYDLKEGDEGYDQAAADQAARYKAFQQAQDGFYWSDENLKHIEDVNIKSIHDRVMHKPSSELLNGVMRRY